MSLLMDWLRHRGKALETLSFLGVIAIVTLLVHDLESRYRTTISAARLAAFGYANVLAEDAARTFEAVDRTLRVAETIRADAETGRYATADAVHQALRQLQKSSPVLLALGWTNARGDVLASSYDKEPPRRNIADLPHFIAQRDQKWNGLYISPPFKSKVTGQWITAVSLPILSQSDGSFSGVVTAPLDQSYFAGIYRSIKPGPRGSVVLMLRDGPILFREPFANSSIDTVASADAMSRADGESVDHRSPTDRRDLITAYQPVPGLPLVICVNLDRSDALREWYNYAMSVGSLGAMLVVFILLATLILARRTRELGKQSALLGATLSNMDQGLIVVDETDAVAICNPRALELLDLPGELMASRPQAKDVLAYQRERGEFDDVPPEVLARLMPQRPGEKNIYERKRPNGTVLEIQTVPFAAGGVVRTYKDITKQKRIEQELKDGEARYRMLADNSTDMIFQLDLKFVRQYVSPASGEILGYAPKELIGNRHFEAIHPDDKDRVENVYREVAKGLERTSVTKRVRHRDGRWIWVETQLRLMRDLEGGPTGILGTLRDISARKKFETEAAEARAAAERAAAAQGQFLANMSHELRTPLNGILGFADIVLERDDLIPEVRRQVSLIKSASDSLLTTVNDILDFSRIEEGQLRLTLSDFSLEALVDNSVSIIRPFAEKKNLELKVCVDKRLPSHWVGDVNRLRQILLNLLNNAIKFTQHGFVMLTVKSLSYSETEEVLHFEVRDTGIGIVEKNLGRLFRRFSQVDGSANRAFTGTGLGLVISKRLVELMGGQIGVNSEAGQGSAFWFTLALPVGARPSTSLSSEKKKVGHASVSARILIAEDNLINQEIARSMLEKAGHIVDIAADGHEAVRAVEREKYDLILMDIQMPGLDGIAATRRILADPTVGVPIVALTANVLPDQIKTFRRAGMKGHIGKPFKREELFETVDRCLAQFPVKPSHAGHESSASISTPTFEAMSEMLGREKVKQLFLKLGAQLQESFLDDPDSEEERIQLAREAHKLISSAGMLGFLPLSESCSKLEAALEANDNVEDCLEVVRKACQAVMEEIAKHTTSTVFKSANSN